MSEYALTEMLRYKRPEGSKTQLEFCKRFLEPTFGVPDRHGNYVFTILEADGEHPVMCFTAHHDTVHRLDGYQDLVVEGDIVKAIDSNCLGADCTTGVWLILGMIEAKIPGVYVVHAGEEIGCVGSRALVKDDPDWLYKVWSVVSFDRRGKDSIVTHQMGRRTASDTFARSLASVIGIPTLKPDNSGVYTDSNEYAQVVPECTNISVGYYNQHTSNESQDISYAYTLLEQLIKADWSKVVFERDETVEEPEEDMFDSGWYEPQGQFRRDSNYNNLSELVRDYPEEVASLLEDWGVDAEYLWNQIGELSFSADYRRVG